MQTHTFTCEHVHRLTWPSTHTLRHEHTFTHTHTQLYFGTQTPCLRLQLTSHLLELPPYAAGCWQPRGRAQHSMALHRWRQHPHPRTLWHPSTPLTRRAEWRELHERFTKPTEVVSVRSWGEAGGWRRKGGREFQGESRSVWSVILYSEKRFSIPPLSSDQSHRGFHQASVTLWILQIASQ